MKTGNAGATAERLAAEALNLPPETPPESVRATIFGMLRDQGFLPGPQEHEAIMVFARHIPACVLRLKEKARARDECRLEAVVEAFASDFFKCSVAERRARYVELASACQGHDRLLARLQGLRSGLLVRTERLHDRSPQVEQLIALSLALFVEAPVSRARCRLDRVTALCAGPNSQRVEWAAAAKRLRRRHRRVARLAPELVADLTRRPAPLFEIPSRQTPRMIVSRGQIGRLALFTIVMYGVGQALRLAETGTKPPATPSLTGPGDVFLRNLMKRTLKEELARAGTRLDDASLQRVAGALPLIQSLNSPFDPRSGAEQQQDNRELLDQALRREGVILDETRLKALARRIFPVTPRDDPIGGTGPASFTRF